MNNDDWNDNGEWGAISKINPRDKSIRLSNAKTREDNVIKTLSKNTLGFTLERYSVYNSNGQETSQTIVTRKGQRLRCPDIYVSHPDSWDNISLRIELKTHDTILSGNTVRVEKEVFNDYWKLQLCEEIETRIVFFIVDSERKYWQTLDILNNYKHEKRDIFKEKPVLMYYWDVSIFNEFTTADEFFKDVQI